MWRETLWVTFYEFKEIGWGSRFHVGWCYAWHNEVIVVDIFKKVEQRADIGVALNLGAFYPVVVGVLSSRLQKPRGVPWPASRKCVRGRGDGRHYVDFYGYRSVLGMPLPAVRKDTRLDDLFDDYGRLRSRGLGTNFSPKKLIASLLRMYHRAASPWHVSRGRMHLCRSLVRLRILRCFVR